MSKLGTKLRLLEGDLAAFWCPGCDEAHQLRIPPHPQAWGFNENGDAPTFTPSVLVRQTTAVPPVTHENLNEWMRQPWQQTDQVRVCHSFVTDGRIQFLGDCTHDLAGQTVDLPDFPD